MYRYIERERERARMRESERERERGTYTCMLHVGYARVVRQSIRGICILYGFWPHPHPNMIYDIPKRLGPSFFLQLHQNCSSEPSSKLISSLNPKPTLERGDPCRDPGRSLVETALQ